MAQTFGKVYQSDWEWIQKQQPCVKELWIDCWAVEKFGESFAKLQTSLSKNAWTKAKAALSHLFEFEPIQKLTESGRWQITGWKVRNLHGSKTQYDGLPLPSQIMGDESVSNSNSFLSHEMGDVALLMGEEAQMVGDEKAVGFDTTGFETLSRYKQDTSNILQNFENPNLSLCSDSLRSTNMDDLSEKENTFLHIDPSQEPDLLALQQKQDRHKSLVVLNEEKNMSRVSRDDGSVRVYITASSREDALQGASKPPNVQSYPRPTTPAFLTLAGGAGRTYPSEEDIVVLKETVQGVLDDTGMVCLPTLSEVCNSFRQLARCEHLLPVRDSYPEYDLMNDWVVVINRELVSFILQGSEVSSVVLGRLE